MKPYFILVFITIWLIGLGAVFALQPAFADPLALQTAAALSIPADISTTVGTSVTVPISFQNGGNAIGSTTFAIDFAQNCLAFDPRDANNDGLPDAVHFNIPAAFRSSLTYDPTHVTSEFNVVIADYSPPIATLPNANPLLTIQFTAQCTPAPGNVLTAPVQFATLPQASFGDVNGLDVTGNVQDGYVTIHALAVPTATPTATRTATPTTTPTATARPSATATATSTAALTPTATPSATPLGTWTATETATSTLPPAPPTVTATTALNTPTATGTTTPTHTPSPSTPTTTPGATAPSATSTPTPSLAPTLQLAIQIQAPETSRSGEIFTYTLTVRNLSQVAATQLTVEDTLPALAMYVTAPAGQFNPTTRQVTWGVPTLAAGASVQVQLRVTATQTVVNHTYAVTTLAGQRFAGEAPALTLIDPALTTALASVQSAMVISSTDGRVSVRIPAAAATTPLTVTLLIARQPLKQAGFAGMGFILTAVDQTGQAVTHFAKPLTLTLHYLDSDWQDAGISDETSLTLMYRDGNRWVATFPCAGCSHDWVNNSFTIVLDHFTLFALRGKVTPTQHAFLPVVQR